MIPDLRPPSQNSFCHIIILKRWSLSLIIWTLHTFTDSFQWNHIWRLLHVSAVQTCVSLLRQGWPAPHREARQKRRELRLKQQAEQEELELRMRELQTANEAKQLELENMRKVRRRHANTLNVPPVNPVCSGNVCCGSSLLKYPGFKIAQSGSEKGSSNPWWRGKDCTCVCQ